MRRRASRHAATVAALTHHAHTHTHRPAYAPGQQTRSHTYACNTPCPPRTHTQASIPGQQTCVHRNRSRRNTPAHVYTCYMHTCWSSMHTGGSVDSIHARGCTSLCNNFAHYHAHITLLFTLGNSLIDIPIHMCNSYSAYTHLFMHSHTYTEPQHPTDVLLYVCLATATRAHSPEACRYTSAPALAGRRHL